MPPGRPCDWCGTDEDARSVRNSVTYEVGVSICDECVLGGVWVEEVDGAAKTVLLAYAGNWLERGWQIKLGDRSVKPGGLQGMRDKARTAKEGERYVAFPWTTPEGKKVERVLFAQDVTAEEAYEIIKSLGW